MKHLNVISKPVERWFHYEKPLPVEMPKDIGLYFAKDSHGNDVMCWLGWETYAQIDRFELLYGHHHTPLNPCEKCKKVECRGEKKCKGFGAWTYGLSMK